jgi:hypothetical protein
MKLKLAIVAAMAVFASTAWSADNGFYVGAGVGMSDLSIDAQGTDHFRGDDFAYKLFVGYDVSKYFGVEGGYYDSGTPSDHGFGISVTGWDMAVLGKWPVTDAFDVHARLGWMWWDANPDGDPSNSGNDVLYGLGVGFKFGDHFAVTGDWERTSPEVYHYNADIDFWTVGMSYKF